MAFSKRLDQRMESIGGLKVEPLCLVAGGKKAEVGHPPPPCIARGLLSRAIWLARKGAFYFGLSEPIGRAV